MSGHTDVAVIGGGQAGLAMSACLGAAGIDHLVIERDRIGERWRSERWPSLRLLTPNWMTRLPGIGPLGRDPDGFMAATAFVELLEGYARRTGAPVLAGTAVQTLEAEADGYRLITTAGTLHARVVVIATGACDLPAVPAWAVNLSPGIRQITPRRYRRAEALPEGGVLVVGASATGAQIAREIRRSGREVVLAAGRHVRAPRRYRGRDLFRWLDASGFLSDPVPEGAAMAKLRTQPSLQLTGSHAAGTVGLTDLAAEGVRIVGRALGGAGRTVRLADTLADEFAAAEARRRKLLARIDAHITAAGIEVTEEPEALLAPAPLPPAPPTLDLAAEGIDTVLWATGYRRAYPWLKLPILGPDGEILNALGRTPTPGLFVLGLPFQRHRASAFIDGVGRDAEALLPAIASHLAGAVRRAA